MPWRVEVAGPARRQLQQLPQGVAFAVVEFVTAVLPTDPLRLSTPLTGQLASLRSARRGDYRLLLQLDEQQRVVIVTRIAHRSQVYRSRP